MMSAKLGCVLLLVIGFTGFAGFTGGRIAVAQPAGDPAPGDAEAERVERAQALYDRATDLYTAGNFAEAVIFYEQALELVKNPDIQYNIARCYEKLAQYSKAIAAFRAYLAIYEEQNGREAPDKTNVEDVIRQLVELEMKPVRLTVTSDPAGANVFVGSRDRLVGQTPFETELDPGTYPLIVELEGYEEERQTVVLERGAPRTFTFRMRRKANMGALLIDTNIRGARIFVQGQVKGLTPYPEEILVPAGRRQVTLEKERYSAVSRIVDVTAGESFFLQEELFLADPPYSWRGYVGWTCVALGVLGIGGGVTIKLVADGTLFEDEPFFQDLQLYQNLSYGLGGGLLALGVGLVVWEYVRTAVDDDDIIPPGERIRPPAAAPPPVTLGVPPGGGLTLHGQFRF